MANPSPILDFDALASDLRLASGYAARAGLLRDPAMLDRLKAAEQGLNADAQPDVQAITRALNDVAQAIAPMTLADLRSGRDPFELRNQRRASIRQLFLAGIAFLIILTIGAFMHALRLEKAGLRAMQQLQAMEPSRKSIELRLMAQFDDPLVKQSPTADVYRQKKAEWVAMFQTRRVLDRQIYDARTTSLIPSPPEIYDMVRSWLVNADPPDMEANTDVPYWFDECVRDVDGTLTLPPEASSRPTPMKHQFADRAEDFCFRNEVLRRLTGDGYDEPQDVGRARFVPEIERKVSMRSDWFLPFLFGCLGAIIFVMRNVASIRTPTMQLFPMLMRIALGGIAGIVIGWFWSPALPDFGLNSGLSVPFTLAFLVGYSIDTLFSVLDRLSHAAAAAAQQGKSASS